MNDSLLGEARGIQQRLETYYGLESGPDVSHFVRQGAAGSREQVLVRQRGEHLELAVILPPAVRKARQTPAVCDWRMQVVEGVSHFVHLSERARTELPTTRLELELQAEIDKFVVLAFSDGAVALPRARAMHSALYQQVRQLHPAGTEAGSRYRLANSLAARLAARLLHGSDPITTRSTLQRFYRSGQWDKIRLALA